MRTPSPAGEGPGPAGDPAAGADPACPAADRPVALAAVAGAHGLAGEVRLKLFTDDADGLARYRRFQAGAQTLTLVAVRAAGGGAIARFREASDRSAAEALRGMLLTVPRSALPPLPEGEYYHADLIDLPVHADDEADGDTPIGRVIAVQNFGAGDVLDIATARGKSFMAPMHAARIEAGRILLDAAFVER